MIRRFVNLVLEDYGGCGYSLHRLDVDKYLFYPSTAQAEAANAKESNNGGGSGGDKPTAPKPPRIKRMRRLPEPSMSFSPFFPPVDDDEEQPSRWPSCKDDAFILLSPGRSEGRILHATLGGRNVVYDADAHAVITTVPSFPEPMERWPVAFSVPGAGGFMEEEESLYVMRSTISPPLPEHNATGSGRFCIAKVFSAEGTISLSCSFDDFETTKGSLTVLIGVEVVRGGEGEGLRMIKHKSKRFMFPGIGIKWVL